MNFYWNRILIVIILLLLFGCGSDSGAGGSVSEGGSLKLRVNPGTAGMRNSGNLSNTTKRSVDLDKISYFNVLIKGDGAVCISDNSVPAAELYNRIYNLKAVKNIVIELEMFDSANTPLNSGTKICGYGNVSADSDSVITISWRTTPVARVIGRLIDEGFGRIQEFDPAQLQKAINERVDGGGNPLAVDYMKISEMIKSDITYSTADMVPTAEISGTVVPGIDSALILIDEPFAAPVSSDASGKFSFSNISPGKWTVSTSDGGSVSVTVNNDGSYSPVPLNIIAGVNSPVLYKWGIVSFNNNGTHEIILTAYAGDMDGLSDIRKVEIKDSNGIWNISLADSGTGRLIDNTPGDGKFEYSVTGEPQNGVYTIRAYDAGSFEEQNRTFAFSSPGVPAVAYPEPDSTVSSRTPYIKWSSVSGADSYNLFILNGGTVIYQVTGIKETGHQIPSDRPLPDGDYKIQLYACNKFDGYSGGLSLVTLNFNVTGVVAPSLSIGDVRNVFYLAKESGGNLKIRGCNLNNLCISDLISTDSPDDLVICDISPDSQTILYSLRGALYRKRINSTGGFLIAERPGDKICSARWSPDGKRIAYSVETEGKFSLFVINHNGSGEKIIDTLVTKNHFAFSRDGAKLYFINSGNSLNVINSDATGLNQLYAASATGANFLLSPDGRKILYGGATVSVINTDGTGFSSISTGSSASKICWTGDNRVVYGKFNTAKTALSMVAVNPEDGVKETLTVFNTTAAPYVYNFYTAPFNYIYAVLGSDRKIVRVNINNGDDLKDIMSDADSEWLGNAVFSHVTWGGV